MTALYGPADVATGVQRFLRGLGFDARAQAPLDKSARMVRVSKIAGSPQTAKTETATVLIEVWDTTQVDSFYLARDIWARFAQVSKDDQGEFPGLVCYSAVPSMPVEYPDPDTPRMSRHQFTVDMHVEFDKLTITEKVNE